MNNASEESHHKIDAAMITEWSMQIREMTAKLSEMEAKLLELNLAGSAMSAMNVATQDNESDLRLVGRSTLWLKVNDIRHSFCKFQPLSRLDWSRWFTDIKEGRLCLYVYGPEDNLHRVHCRKSETPRLAHEDGELWWVVYP